jgi:hypothetical protein
MKQHQKFSLLSKLIWRCLALIVLTSAVSTNVFAQNPPLPICPNDGECDSVAMHDTVSTNCFRYRINNVGFTDKLTEIELISDPANGFPINGHICTVSVDTSGIINYSDTDMLKWALTSQTPFEWDIKDTTGAYQHSLSQCDSGFLKICFCCNDHNSYFYPLHIRMIHRSSTPPFAITQICDFYDTLVINHNSCNGGHWDCDSTCNRLTIGTPYFGVDNRYHFCATITQKSAGALHDVSLSIACSGTGTERNWDVESMPTGWYNSSGLNFVDTTTGGNASPNCSSTTFCFVSDACGSGFCDSMTVTMTSESENDGCVATAPLILTPDPTAKTDNGCCPSLKTAKATTPTQDQGTGKWSWCVDVKITGNTSADTLTNLTICHNNPRCIQLTSIASGWVLSSTTTVAGITCDVFKRTTAPDTGCRTFQFCYETCDCLDVAKSVAYSFSGDNGFNPPAVPNINVSIPRDAGTCCNGVWHKKDWIEVIYDPLFANCLTYILHNTNYNPATGSCKTLNDFHFTTPSPCNISGITVSPAGFTGTHTGNIVDVVPSPGSSTTINCCATMTVKVCFDDCWGPFSPYVIYWSSTKNGTHITDSTQTVTPGPLMHPLDVEESENSVTGQPNYPNPFGAPDFKTMIPYETDGRGVAEIEVTNASGKLVVKDQMEVDDAGKHFFFFTGKELPSGTYYYRVWFPKGKKVIVNRSMILVK